MSNVTWLFANEYAMNLILVESKRLFHVKSRWNYFNSWIPTVLYKVHVKNFTWLAFHIHCIKIFHILLYNFIFFNFQVICNFIAKSWSSIKSIHFSSGAFGGRSILAKVCRTCPMKRTAPQRVMMMMMTKANGTGISPSDLGMYTCIAQYQWAFPCVLRNHREVSHFKLQ